MKYINEDTKNMQEINIKKEIDFNKNGTVSQGKEKTYAKIVESEKDKTYLIQIYQNQPFDPMGSEATRENYLETKLKRVSKDTFDFYLIYLQTKNSIYLTRTNRRLINE